MALEDLKKQAEELNIEVEDTDDEAKLTAKIDEAKKKKGLGEDSLSYWKDEAKKAFEMRDNLKKDRQTLKSELDRLKAEKDSLISKEEYENAVKELKALKSFKEQLEEEKKKHDEEKLSEVEKLKLQVEKAKEDAEKREKAAKEVVETQYRQLLEQVQSELGNTKSLVDSLRINHLESEIMKAANKYNAINPSHIFNMVKDVFEYEKDLKKYVFYKYDEKGKPKDMKDVDEYVKEFLSDETNDYLVKSDANDSSLRAADMRGGGKPPKDFGGYDPKDPDIKRLAVLEGLTPEEYINIVLIPLEKKKEAISKYKK